MPVLYEGVASELTMTAAVGNITNAATQVMGIISANELFFTLFCGSIVFLACTVVRKLKKTAKA